MRFSRSQAALANVREQTSTTLSEFQRDVCLSSDGWRWDAEPRKSREAASGLRRETTPGQMVDHYERCNASMNAYLGTPLYVVVAAKGFHVLMGR
jgi:hypothetical protein